MKNNTLSVIAAITGKKLISKKIYNQEKTRAFLELRNKNEIWVRGQFHDWHWLDGPEFQVDTLPDEIKQIFLNENHFATSKSSDLRQAIKIAWHEAAKKHVFFKGADVFQEDHLLAKRTYNCGQAAAFLEVRDGSEFWVYGKFYEPRSVRGPEIKIELDLTPEVKEELLLRESWTEPMTTTVKNAVLQAWKQAAEKNSFFNGLIA